LIVHSESCDDKKPCLGAGGWPGRLQRRVIPAQAAAGARPGLAH